MKIIIFYASYGGGHLSSAKAMKEAINEKYPEYDVQLIDCMEYLNKNINRITVGSYEFLAKKGLWGIVYSLSRKGPVAWISNLMNEILANKLGRLIDEISPNLIISTHMFSTQMCGILKKRGKLHIASPTILTDFKYHEQWLVKHKYIEQFFCSNEKMKEDLIKYGLSEKKVFATGLPISQRFFKEFDKDKILEEFGLKKDLKTILFFAGGRMGLSRKSVFEYMKSLAKGLKGFQVVAISGKNAEVYNRFKEIANGKDNIKVIEYTDKVPELMSVSDLVITKPGGATASEALVSNLPILEINPIPGQEEENAEYLEEIGVAIWLKKKENFEDVIKKVTKDEVLNSLKENTKKYAKMNAAQEICKIIFKD